MTQQELELALDKALKDVQGLQSQMGELIKAHNRLIDEMAPPLSGGIQMDEMTKTKIQGTKLRRPWG